MAEKKYFFFEGKLRQRHENGKHLLIVRILLLRSSTWKVSYLPETSFVSFQQKIFIKSNWPPHTKDLNVHVVASDGCNGLRSVLFVDASDLGAFLLKIRHCTSKCVTKNDTTDFLCYCDSLK